MAAGSEGDNRTWAEGMVRAVPPAAEERNYPAPILRAGADARFPTFMALGSLSPLNSATLALLCSARCPGGPILCALDLAHELRNATRTVVGGFHSPVEQDCLMLLLRGTARIVVCPARDITGMRVPSTWRPALASGRLLVLSPFVGVRRVTARTARARNELVATLADEVLVLHAAAGSGTERLALALLAAGRTVLTPADPANAPLIQRGAISITTWAAYVAGPGSRVRA